jgi:cytochrome c oxidase subunit I+III
VHAAAALIGIMNGYALLHAALAVLMLTFIRARRRAGYQSAARRGEVRIATLWSNYAAAAGLIAALATQLPALLR